MHHATGSDVPDHTVVGHFDYERAFSRHLGLITADEQEVLRKSRVAIVGLGGVGGIHLATLARLGIGAFSIADPDSFELANFNRQYGAGMSTLGGSKASVMAAEARDINPEVSLRVFPEAITEQNAGTLLDGVDVLVDGIDFFALDTRRMVFLEARRRGIWAVTAGPIGFSTAWLVFSPLGMSFDEYFGLHEGMAPLERFVAFLHGLAPRGIHRGYMDLARVDVGRGRGPSAALACQLCAGVAAAEVVKILLRRGPVRAVPEYAQFDGYRGQLVCGTFRNSPLSKLKRKLMCRHLKRLGWGGCADGERPDASFGLDPRTHIDPVLLPLLYAAARAPSGDNTQAWRFVIDPGKREVSLVLDESRDGSPMNAGQCMARVAVGAAVENLLRVAREGRWLAELDLAPPQALVTIRLGGGGRPGCREEVLVSSRTTNRRLYDGRSLTKKELERLARDTPEHQGVTTLWIVERGRVSRLAGLIGTADALMFGDRSMRDAFLANVRFDRPPCECVMEGLSLACLELTRPERTGLRVMRQAPEFLLSLGGAFRMLAAKSRELVSSASGVCIVIAPDETEATDVAVGRSMQRAWLALTAQGIAAQPMMSLPVLENALVHGAPSLRSRLGEQRVRTMAEEFRAIIPQIGRGRVAFLLRFGYAPPPSGRTGRRPLAELTTVLGGE